MKRINKNKTKLYKNKNVYKKIIYNTDPQTVWMKFK